jgi:hypothetical protein
MKIDKAFNKSTGILSRGLAGLFEILNVIGLINE